MTKIITLFFICIVTGGCSKDGYRPMTLELWDGELKHSSYEMVDISKLNSDEIEILIKQNPDSKFYYAKSGVRMMENKKTNNYSGFIEKTYMTPVTIIADGIVISVVLGLNGYSR